MEGEEEGALGREALIDTRVRGKSLPIERTWTAVRPDVRPRLLRDV